MPRTRPLNAALAISIAIAGAIFAVVLTSCSGDDKSSSPANAPTAASSAASSSATTTTANTATSRELQLMKTVPPLVANLVAALKKGDLAAAKGAYEAYDARWNGIEVYVNYRSRELYGKIETDLQAQIADGLSQPQPNLTALAVLAEQMGARYDEAVALSTKGPELSPLFDDLADLRIARADLRIVTAALTAKDLNKAKASFATFKKNFPAVEPIIKARSATADNEAGAAIAAADAKFSQVGVTVDELVPLVAAVTDRYNFGVNLLNAAARNTDLKKTAFTEADLTQLKGLNTIALGLRSAQVSWDAGDTTKSGSVANQALTTDFAAVQGALAAKSSDAALQNALKAYAGLAGAPGDATRVKASNKTALEAVAIAQQVLVGQFWTQPKLQEALAALPK